MPEQCRSLSDLPVLVADDNVTNRQIHQEMLTAWRLRVITVASGIDAQKALRQSTLHSEPFRLVILNAMMPGMDGLEPARRIHQQPDLTTVLIILLSSECFNRAMRRRGKVWTWRVA